MWEQEVIGVSFVGVSGESFVMEEKGDNSRRLT